MGHPFEYDREAILQTVCDHIVVGQSLIRILQEQQGMPRYTTFMDWLANDRKLAEKYAQAKAEQADYLADELVSIADNATDANLARLQVDARKWVASKLKPKRYGDNLQVNHSGKLDVITMTDADLIRIIQEQTGQPLMIEGEVIEG